MTKTEHYPDNYDDAIEAMEEARRSRDIAVQFIAGMLMTMHPPMGHGEIVGYVVLNDVFEAAKSAEPTIRYTARGVEVMMTHEARATETQGKP